jgi:hypothetical protein
MVGFRAGCALAEYFRDIVAYTTSTSGAAAADHDGQDDQNVFLDWYAGFRAVLAVWKWPFRAVWVIWLGHSGMLPSRKSHSVC